MRKSIRRVAYLSFALLLTVLVGCSSQESQNDEVSGALGEYFATFTYHAIKYDPDGKSNLRFCEGNEPNDICYNYKFMTITKDNYSIVQMEYENKQLYEDSILTITYPDKAINYGNANNEEKAKLDSLKKNLDEHLEEKGLSWNHFDELLTKLRIQISQEE